MCALAEPGIRFEAWRGKIETAPSIDQLLRVVRLYLAGWPPEANRLLPSDLAASAQADTEAIYARAYVASRAELAMAVDDPGYVEAREMALTMSAAAARLRILEAYRSVAVVNAAGIGSGLPRGITGELEAVVRVKG